MGYWNAGNSPRAPTAYPQAQTITANFVHSGRPHCTNNWNAASTWSSPFEYNVSGQSDYTPFPHEGQDYHQNQNFFGHTPPKSARVPYNATRNAFTGVKAKAHPSNYVKLPPLNEVGTLPMTKGRVPPVPPPPYSALADDERPPSLSYPYPPPTSFNNCSFHYNSIPQDHPLWNSAPRRKNYDLNRPAGDNQLAPVPNTSKLPTRSGRIWSRNRTPAASLNAESNNEDRRMSRRDQYMNSCIQRSATAEESRKDAPDASTIETLVSTKRLPSAMKTRKTRGTQVRRLNSSANLRDECTSTTNHETTMSNPTQDLLQTLATQELAELAPLTIKGSGDKELNFASELSMLIKSKSVAKRQHRNVFKLESHHEDAHNVRSALNSQPSRRVLHRSSKPSKDGPKVNATSPPIKASTKVRLVQSTSSLQKIYFAGLRKRRSRSAFQSPHYKCSSLTKSSSCPLFLAKRHSNVQKSISYCYGDKLALPRVLFIGRKFPVASSSEISSVKRVIAELLKGNLSEEAVDIVTVANREYYVMPVICSLSRKPAKPRALMSWRTFQCSPSCCTTGCQPCGNVNFTHEISQSPTVNSSVESFRSKPCLTSTTRQSETSECGNVMSGSMKEILFGSAKTVSTFKTDFLCYYESTECGTRQSISRSVTPEPEIKRDEIFQSLKPLALTPPSTADGAKTGIDLSSKLGRHFPRQMTPILCYTCRTCSGRSACCSRSCSPCRFPCQPYCPPMCPSRSCSPCGNACGPCFDPFNPYCLPCRSCSPVCRPSGPPPVPPRPTCRCPPPPPPVPPPNRKCVTAPGPCCYPQCSSSGCVTAKDSCSSPNCCERSRSCSPSPPPCPFPRPCYRPPTPERCLPCAPMYRPCQPEDACCPLPPLCCPKPRSPCKPPPEFCCPRSPPACCPPPWCPPDPCCPPRCPSPNKCCPRPYSPPRCPPDPCCPFPACIPPCPPAPPPCFNPRCCSPPSCPPPCPPPWCPPKCCPTCGRSPGCSPPPPCPRKPLCCPRSCPPPCTVVRCPSPCRPCSPCKPCSPCRPVSPSCRPVCSPCRPCSPYCPPARPPPCVPKRRRTCCAPCTLACPPPCPPPCPSPLCRRCCGKRRRRRRKCLCCFDENPNFIFPQPKPYAACTPGCLCPEEYTTPYPGCCP